MKENYFLKRRSCRKFNSKKINEEKLKEIIFKASKAPTCGNMQLYSVIITEDPDKLTELAKLHYNQPAATSTPVILTICADFNRITRWCEINKAKPGFNNFHSFITALTDAIIFAQQIVTIAEQEGFGTCYLGTVNYNAPEITQLLKLPTLVIPVASLAIGYPDEDGEKTDRLPVEGLIHYESYSDWSEEEIKRLYRIHDNNPDNKKFLEANNKANLAQVFAEVRYPENTNREISEKFISLIKEQGFLNDK